MVVLVLITGVALSFQVIAGAHSPSLSPVLPCSALLRMPAYAETVPDAKPGVITSLASPHKVRRDQQAARGASV